LGASNNVLPNNELVKPPYPDKFLGGRGQDIAKFCDSENGGIALNNPTKGLNYQVWQTRIINPYTSFSSVLLRAQNLAEFELLQHPYLCDFSFSFDVNMQLAYAYTVYIDYKKHSYFTYYDTKLNDFHTIYLKDVYTPRVAFDDKRSSDNFNISDVVLAYIKNNQLFVRYSRDRYLIEYHLQDEEPTTYIEKIGMNAKQRFQILRQVD